MNKCAFLKKLGCLSLVIAMLLSMAAPAMAAERGINVSFEPVSNDTVSATLLPELQEQAAEEQPLYADTEEVRVSIVMEGDSVLDRGYEAANLAENRGAMNYRQRLMDNQNAVTQKIEDCLGEELDVAWNLTLAANLISANVKYGQIQEIACIDGVKEVIIESQYYPAVLPEEETTVSPQMVISTQMTGMNGVFNSGYTGAGSRVAIIDTGLDPDHQSFAEAGYLYAMEENAAAAGLPLETYKDTLNLLESQELASKISSTNAARKKGNLKLSDVMFSEKVPFGFNYVDADLNISHDYDKQTDHGSHVAGIAAANRYIQTADGNFISSAEKYKVVGNAPDAQLIVMKVFGVTGGGVDSDIVAACEDAILLGADSINLSLGSTKNGFSESATYKKIMETLENSVSVMAVAAANDGHWADYANTEAYLGSGYLYTDDVMYDRVAAPGSLTNSLTVASVDNSGQISDAFFTVLGQDGTEYSTTYGETLYNKMKAFNTLDTSENGKGTEYEFVLLDGLGNKSDFTYLDVEGKIVVIPRGELAFYEKATNAVQCGAIATIIFNNTGGTIGMDLTSYEGEAPCVSVTQEVGAKIKSMANRETAYDNSVYYTGTMKVVGSLTVMDDEKPHYTMSYFSSWGTIGDLSLKPEITAPGGSIRSVRGDVAATNKYKLNSGTSMATPQVSGVVATFKEYLRESGLANKFGGMFTERQLTQSLMMSTAVPLKDGDGNYYPVLQQGAGLVNGEAMVGSSSLIMMTEDATVAWKDGKVKAELGDDPERKGEYGFSFTIYNGANAAQTYRLSADLFSQDYFEAQANIDSKITAYYTSKNTHPLESAATFTAKGGKLDGNDIVIAAGDSAVVTVKLTLTDDAEDWMNEYFPQGTYLQGYVFVEPQTYGDGIKEATHSIPVLAFYGNWTDPSMFDGPSVHNGEIITVYSSPSTTDNSRMAYIESAEAIVTRNEYNVPNYGMNHVTVTVDGKSAYAYGGNPLVKDEVYMPERDALSIGSVVDTWYFSAMRDVESIEYGVRNLTTGESLYRVTSGSLNGSYYSKSSGAWVWVCPYYKMNYILPEQNDGDILEIYLTALPEYYSPGKMGENSTPGHGATLQIKGPLDSTAPVVSEITLNKDGTLDVTAVDSHYVAAVVLYNGDGTRVISYTGAKQKIQQGESAVYTVDTAGSRDNTYLLQVYDYAMNPATYYMELNENEITYSGNLLAYNLEEKAWVQLSKLSDRTAAVTGAIREYTAATSNSDTIWAVAYGNELYRLSVKDPETPAFIKELPFVPVDMAYSAKDCYLYAVTEESQLVRIDPETGNYRIFGATPIQTNTLACDKTGVFYSHLYGTGKIYSYTLDAIKPENLNYDFDGDGTFGEADCRTLLAYVTGERKTLAQPEYADLDSDGDLDTYDVRLALDKVHGRATLVADNGVQSKYMQSMEMDPNDGILYWSSYSTEYIGDTEIGFSVLYGFDVVTGEYTRYADVWDQMSCLLVLDKDAGNLYEPVDGTVNLDGVENKRYVGATECAGVAVVCGVDNSRKAEYLAAVENEKTVTVDLTASCNTYNALYTVTYDAAVMTLEIADGYGELNSFVQSNDMITFGCAGSTAVLAGEKLAELTFTVTSCEAEAVIRVVEQNQEHPGTVTTTDTGSHQWGKWNEQAPSCSQDGQRSRVCDLCHTVEAQVLPADEQHHIWSDWTVVTVATANVPGLQERVCGDCQEIDWQWKLSSSMESSAVTVHTGTIPIDEDYIAEARITGAGIQQVWRLKTADGSIRYLVELSADTKKDDLVAIRLEQTAITGSGAGCAIRKQKAASIQWEDNELDYTVQLEGGAGSMTAYSYYNGTSYTELDIYLLVDSEGNNNGEVTYITTPAQSSGFNDSYISQIGVWEAEVTKFYWVSQEDATTKLGYYDAYIWLAPELADDFQLELEFNGSRKVYLCDSSGNAVGDTLAETGLSIRLNNGAATVKLVQLPTAAGTYKRYFTIHLRNYINDPPVLSGDSSGEIYTVVGYSRTIDLDPFFEDPNGDPLTYAVSVNGGKPNKVNRSQFELKPISVGTLELEFTANDGTRNSEEIYHMTVHVVNSGDLNLDGDVDEKDAALLQRYLAKWPTQDGAFVDAGDVNADGKVNLTDYILLRRYLADWPGVTLGVTK